MLDGQILNSVMVCFPIKSGQEIKSDSVPESVAYQVMKPFIHLYGDCVVIFITAKKCSQPLGNYIKKLQTIQNPPLPIDVLQNENLCKIFKFYKLLD